jgi:hypothetical protein
MDEYLIGLDIGDRFVHHLELPGCPQDGNLHRCLLLGQYLFSRSVGYVGGFN